jgi:4-hydroxybenzoate polyprenyltransferase/phosphoserine phosphatase
MGQNEIRDPVPLCVDLDGTLLRSDVLVEALIQLVKQDPMCLIRVPFWLFRGKAYLKERLAQRVDLDVEVLPYHTDVVNILRGERERGRRIVLATATHRKFAEAIAHHLGLFDEVLATSGDINLSGKRKRQTLVDRYGERSFEYLATEAIDLDVCKHARKVLLVNAPRGVVARASGLTEVDRVLERRSGGPGAYLRALRPHQWLKNLLLFVPLLAAHQAGNIAALADTVIGFVAYGLAASSAYIVNDLLDLESDRHHPRKRLRPFASGNVPILHGVVLAGGLLGIAIGLSFALPVWFRAVLLVYVAITLAYSLWLKRLVLVDVLTLAGLYTLRILAGAAIMRAAPSFWLLAFSMFMFLSLALVKRYSELMLVRDEGRAAAKGRGYELDDLSVLVSLGTASGYLSVLVTALYVNSSDVVKLYTRPEVLWLVCPLILFWISRVWILAHRGLMHDDPVVFAVSDRWSLVVGLLVVAAIWFAT